MIILMCDGSSKGNPGESKKTKRIPSSQKGKKYPNRKRPPKFTSEHIRKLSGENNWHWKGLQAGFVPKHEWIRNHYGYADHCENPNCSGFGTGRWHNIKTKQYDWANISGLYLRDVKDYIQLCRSCHLRFDRGTRNRLTYKDIFENKTNSVKGST